MTEGERRNRWSAVSTKCTVFNGGSDANRGGWGLFVFEEVDGAWTFLMWSALRVTVPVALSGRGDEDRGGEDTVPIFALSPLVDADNRSVS